MSASDIKIKILGIIDTDKLTEQVEIYCDMMQRIKEEKTITPVIRFAFENYYGMKQARLSPVWKGKYFESANRHLRPCYSGKERISF